MREIGGQEGEIILNTQLLNKDLIKGRKRKYRMIEAF